jgi:phosphoglucomutase
MTFNKDLAMATAEREGAFYVLAQDPDSDRFSGAERGSVAPFSLLLT